MAQISHHLTIFGLFLQFFCPTGYIYADFKLEMNNQLPYTLGNTNFLVKIQLRAPLIGTLSGKTVLVLRNRHMGMAMASGRWYDTVRFLLGPSGYCVSHRIFPNECTLFYKYKDINVKYRFQGTFFAQKVVKSVFEYYPRFAHSKFQ